MVINQSECLLEKKVLSKVNLVRNSSNNECLYVCVCRDQMSYLNMNILARNMALLFELEKHKCDC